MLLTDRQTVFFFLSSRRRGGLSLLVCFTVCMYVSNRVFSAASSAGRRVSKWFGCKQASGIRLPTTNTATCLRSVLHIRDLTGKPSTKWLSSAATTGVRSDKTSWLGLRIDFDYPS